MKYYSFEFLICSKNVTMNPAFSCMPISVRRWRWARPPVIDCSGWWRINMGKSVTATLPYLAKQLAPSLSLSAAWHYTVNLWVVLIIITQHEALTAVALYDSRLRPKRQLQNWNVHSVSLLQRPVSGCSDLLQVSLANRFQDVWLFN